MNNVEIAVKDIDLPLWSKGAEKFAIKVLRELKKENWELSILFCNDKTIQELNREYRGKNKPTDILSFSLGETVHKGKKSAFLPGDIVISLDSLRKNASDFKITEDEELRRLIIHGILHLDGMDHKTNRKGEKMLVLQEEILSKLKYKEIIAENGGKR